MTYATTISRRGRERWTAELRMSDTYAGLRVADPVYVSSFLTLGGSRKDIDIDIGTQAADEMDFTLDERLILNEADVACAAFLLDAQESSLDPAKKRYVGIVLNPSSPLLPSDFEFRGLLDPAMSAEDILWEGDEFNSDPNPLRQWKMQASSYDISELLGFSVGDLVNGVEGEYEGIEQAWIDANVADRLGWFDVDDGDGHREGRYADLVNLRAVLQKLVDKAVEVSGSGVTVTIPNVVPDFVPSTARFRHGTVSEGEVDVRYGRTSWWYHLRHRRIYGPDAPNPYALDYPYDIDNYRPSDVSLDALDVSWRLLKPSKEEEGFAWTRYDSLAELLYEVAFSLLMWIEWEYVDHETIICHFRSRQTMANQGAVYLADAVSASLDIQPLPAEEQGLREISCRWAQGGTNVWYEFLAASDARVPADGFEKEAAGKILPLSFGATFENAHSNDAPGRDAGEDVNPWPLPHNGIFWDDGARKDEADLRFTAAGLHTSLYVRYTTSITDPCPGCAGKVVSRPVGGAVLLYQGVYYECWTLTDMLTRVIGNDKLAFETEYQITVPYLTRFRSTPGGAEGWRNLKLGKRYTQDGREYIVVGIERDFVGGKTTIRLHGSSRFGFEPVVDPPALVLPSVPNEIRIDQVETSSKIETAGEAIPQFAAVMIAQDGNVYVARPDASSYRLVIGIAITAAAEGEKVQVVTDGDITIPGHGLPVGQSLFLRAPESSDAQLANLSTKWLTTEQDAESLFYVLGQVRSTGKINVAITTCRFLHERAVVVGEGVGV